MKYTIPTYKVKVIIKKLEALNKRIVGMDGRLLEYVVLPSYQKAITVLKRDDKTNIETQVLVDVVDIDIQNPIVSLNGWSFLAIIEHSKVGNIVMKKLYSVDIPEQYLTSDTYCEHCNTDRYRKFTYLVYKAETNEIHQVGSTCLTAYLGFDASLLMAHAKLFNEMNDMMDNDRELGRMTKRGVEVQNIELFLKRTIAVIEKTGYVSAKKAREDAEKNRHDLEHPYLTATGDIVWGIEYDKKYWKDELHNAASEAVDETYKKVIDWVKNIENKSDYIHNIKVLVDRGYVTYKTATTAASIVGVWLMNENKKKVESKVVSNHFGTIKERIDVDMVLKSKVIFEGKYGMSNCYRFVTAEGNIATWFTAAAQLVEGVRYVGKATVVKHDEYKGTKQTLLNRCVLKAVEVA
jgi:hypothetical protein